MAVQEETDLMKKLIIELENSGEGAEDSEYLMYNFLYDDVYLFAITSGKK